MLLKSGYENDQFHEDFIRVSNELSFNQILQTGNVISETLENLNLNINPRLSLDMFILKVHNFN